MLLGLFLAIIGFNLLVSNSALGILLFLVGVVALALLMNNGWNQASAAWKGIAASFMPPEAAERPAAVRETRQRSAAASQTRSTMHRAATRAILNAGQDPQTLPVVPTDIGMLAYPSSDSTPTLFREANLPGDAAYIRPFTLLRSPQRARGKIRFEVLDEDGVRRFVDEQIYDLSAGETFVYPDTWLPVRNLESLEGSWTLAIYAANVLLAEHVFVWQDVGGGAFRTYLTGDGEISDKLIDELSGTRLERLSLQDLLEDLDGTVVRSDPEAEAAARRNEQINRQHTTRRR